MLELKFCMSTARWKDCLHEGGRPLLPSRGAPLLLGVQPPCIGFCHAFRIVSFLLTLLAAAVQCLLTGCPARGCEAPSTAKATGDT